MAREQPRRLGIVDRRALEHGDAMALGERAHGFVPQRRVRVVAGRMRDHERDFVAGVEQALERARPPRLITQEDEPHVTRRSSPSKQTSAGGGCIANGCRLCERPYAPQRGTAMTSPGAGSEKSIAIASTSLGVDRQPATLTRRVERS